MQTQPFVLTYGIEYNGVVHSKGELRLPTLMDLEETLKKFSGEDEKITRLRVSRAVWAKTILRLGDIPKEELTEELLGTAIDTEYDILTEAENTLRKKRLLMNEAK